MGEYARSFKIAVYVWLGSFSLVFDSSSSSGHVLYIYVCTRLWRISLKYGTCSGPAIYYVMSDVDWQVPSLSVVPEQTLLDG